MENCLSIRGRRGSFEHFLVVKEDSIDSHPGTRLESQEERVDRIAEVLEWLDLNCESENMWP